MVAYGTYRGLEAEQIGPVTVVTITDRRLLDEGAIRAVAGQLTGLVERLGCRQLVLNLGSVERLSARMLGELLTLSERLRQRGGRLVLCRMDPELDELLRVLKLRTVLPAYREEQEALQTF
jgi:stage II sporulation protein AA (anti-sigma F factor antagonist)